jgi:hypothetical protein
VVCSAVYVSTVWYTAGASATSCEQSFEPSGWRTQSFGDWSLPQPLDAPPTSTKLIAIPTAMPGRRLFVFINSLMRIYGSTWVEVCRADIISRSFCGWSLDGACGNLLVDMSRVLAQLMGAAEPAFRAQLLRLEKAAGLPGADIRLMMEVVNETRSKIRELGLDPHDTTGKELYAALQTRLLKDEVQVRAHLNIRADNSPEAVLEAVCKRLEKLQQPTQTFVVKQSAMRTLLKKLQPKATMKKLGYRSMASMIKHEPVAQLLAAAAVIESRDWQHKRLEAYKKLKSRDFEVKKASFLLPKSKNWPAVSAEYVGKTKHNIVAVPELGAVIILPIEHDLPGLAITTMLLAVDYVNDMRSLGSYLKLQQVRPDYGEVFTAAMQHEPMTAAELAGQPLPWKMLQWFYGRGHSEYYPEAFEPHVQPEDLSWHTAEDVLAQLHPALEFWQGNQLLALVDGTHTVSLNMLDVALSVCNGLSYSQRIVQHMRTDLGRELLARYLHQGNLHAMLLGQLDEQLTPELAFGDNLA